MSAPVAAAVSISPMGEADLDTVSALEADVAAFPWTRGHFSDCLKAGYSGWVLKVDEVIAGYAVLMMAVDEGHLLNIGIASSFQRRGLGAQMLEHVLARTRQSGGVSLLLEVRPSNDKALALYQRYGFGEIGRRKAYYPAHIGREDALVLRRALEDQT
ncbi:MAG TPA: ribosomal protein S18-alanine N-acetyltransferase [Rhodocyclaceae bacterium]|nr:ribosomal protein S18-alanine N-acetyltransferase [Rhodocyclaceae bacterium]